MGIGTMTREEKAVIYVASEYLTESPLISNIEGFDEVHFEVELVHFTQVCKKCFLVVIIVVCFCISILIPMFYLLRL